MTTIHKTIYLCPVEGSVPRHVIHTHTYRFKMTDNQIRIGITNNGFMIEGIEKSMIETTREEIQRKINLNPAILNGDMVECFNELNDEFIESIVRLHYMSDEKIINYFK